MISIFDKDAAISYDDIFTPWNTNQTMRERLAEAQKLPTNEAFLRILKLAIFLPYSDVSGQEFKEIFIPTAEQVDRSIYLHRTTLAVLDGQADYMILAEKASKAGVIYTPLALDLDEAGHNSYDLHPLVGLTAYNYSGLAYMKAAENTLYPDRKKSGFGIAENIFSHVTAKAISHEDVSFPLLSAFYRFNYARASKKYWGDNKVAIAHLGIAIEARETVATTPLPLPNFIRKGLEGEVHYARATLASLYPNHKSVETYRSDFVSWSADQSETPLIKSVRGLYGIEQPRRPSPEPPASLVLKP